MSSIATSVELPPHPEPAPFVFDQYGRAQVGGTRVTLEVLLGRYRLGDTFEDLHSGFPTVPAGALRAVIAYYGRHTAVIDRWLDMKAEEFEETRRKLDALHGTEWWQELLRKRAESEAKSGGERPATGVVL